VAYKPIRSTRGLLILVLLSRGVKRTADIAEALDLETKVVSSYLNVYRRCGLVTRSGPIWSLTDKGYEVLNETLESIRKLNEFGKISVEPLKQTKEYKRIQNLTKVHKRIQKSFVTITGLTGFLNRVETVLGRKLNELEKKLLTTLWTHFARTGSRYLYWSRLQQVVEVEDILELKEAIKELKQHNIVYLWLDRQIGDWKIGLKQRITDRE